MRAALVSLLLFGWFALCGQTAQLFFKNEAKIRAVVIHVLDHQLVTETTSYPLRDIRSITFWNQQPDSLTTHELRKSGVTVYLKNSRLPALKETQNFTEYNSNFSLGLGLGLEYGGIGTKLTVLNSSRVGFFGGLGYFLESPGYNIGFDLKFNPKKRGTGFITGMYGFNSILIDELVTEISNGFSVGMGVKLVGQKSDKNYTSLAFLIPFRDSEFKELAKARNAFVIPALFSIGYNFGL